MSRTSLAARHNDRAALNIKHAILASIKKLGAEEGCDHAEVAAYFDVEVDYDYRKLAWAIAIRTGRHMVQLRYFDESKAEQLVNEIGSPLSRSLLGIQSIAGEIARSKLDAHFPRAIARIECVHHYETEAREFEVIFKNGHKYRCAEAELFSQYSLATMSLLYDLPSMGDRSDP